MCIRDSSFIVFLLISISTFTAQVYAADAVWPSKTTYKYVNVNGKKIFYREAGAQHKQTIVLLHGYPSSSHSYRELIPLLSGRYHVIAPDYLGSGYSARPNPKTQKYTFELLAQYVEGLLTTLKVKRYSLYIQDFGAPVGFRMLLNNPNKLDALIVQNGNAYLKDVPNAEIHLLDSGHFSVEEKPVEIAKYIVNFMDKL